MIYVTHEDEQALALNSVPLNGVSISATKSSEIQQRHLKRKPKVQVEPVLDNSAIDDALGFIIDCEEITWTLDEEMRVKNKD